jgi:hypothetical protein
MALEKARLLEEEGIAVVLLATTAVATYMHS